MTRPTITNATIRTKGLSGVISELTAALAGHAYDWSQTSIDASDRTTKLAEDIRELFSAYRADLRQITTPQSPKPRD